MSVIPIISSAADVPAAIRHAQKNPGSRWYVARRTHALGAGELVPTEWGITAGCSTPMTADASPEKRKRASTIQGTDSFPIENCDDVKKAVRAYGRAGDKDAAKKHILSEAGKLGCMDNIPDDWKGTTASADPIGLTESQEDGTMGPMLVDPLTAAGWDNELHPRDRDGRFIEVGDLIDIFSAAGGIKPIARGKATGVEQNSSGISMLTVTKDDGTTVRIRADKVKSAPDTKARLDEGAPHAVGDDSLTDHSDDAVARRHAEAMDITNAEADAAQKERHAAVAQQLKDKRADAPSIDTDNGEEESPFGDEDPDKFRAGSDPADQVADAFGGTPEAKEAAQAYLAYNSGASMDEATDAVDKMLGGYDSGIDVPDGWPKDGGVGAQAAEARFNQDYAEQDKIQFDGESTRLTDDARGDLEPIRELLDVDREAGSWASGMRDWQFDSLLEAYSDWQEDPETTDPDTDRRLRAVQRLANQHNIDDPTEIIEFRHAMLDLGWAQEEQFNSILDGEPFEEQNSNALANIADKIRRGGLAGHEFGDGTSLEKLAEDIDRYNNGEFDTSPEGDLNDSIDAVGDMSTRELEQEYAVVTSEDFSGSPEYADAVINAYDNAGLGVDEEVQLGPDDQMDVAARHEPDPEEIQRVSGITGIGSVGTREILSQLREGDGDDIPAAVERIRGDTGLGEVMVRETVQAATGQHPNQTSESTSSLTGDTVAQLREKLQEKQNEFDLVRDNPDDPTKDSALLEELQTEMAPIQAELDRRENTGPRVKLSETGPVAVSVAPGGESKLPADQPGFIAPDTSRDGGSPYAVNPFGGPQPAHGTPEWTAKNTLGVALARAADKTSHDYDAERTLDDMAEIFNETDRDAAHRRLAILMTRLKLGGKQRARYKGLFDTYKGWDAGKGSAPSESADVAPGRIDGGPSAGLEKGRPSGNAAVEAMRDRVKASRATRITDETFASQDESADATAEHNRRKRDLTDRGVTVPPGATREEVKALHDELGSTGEPTTPEASIRSRSEEDLNDELSRLYLRRRANPKPGDQGRIDAINQELIRRNREELAPTGHPIQTAAGPVDRGDIITYTARGGEERTIMVQEVSDDIKNGEPGFSGFAVNPDGTPNPNGSDGWGYADQDVRLVRKHQGKA